MLKKWVRILLVCVVYPRMLDYHSQSTKQRNTQVRAIYQKCYTIGLGTYSYCSYQEYKETQTHTHIGCLVFHKNVEITCSAGSNDLYDATTT